MNDTYHDPRQFWKQNQIIIGLSIVLLIISLVFNKQLYGIFGEQNYLGVHLLIEIFIITICFTIAIQSWMTFPQNLSSYRLWIGTLFFAVGLLKITHALTYEGMPFFLTESGSDTATWFYFVGRLTEALGMLAIVCSKDRFVSSRNRWWTYSLAFLYACIWIAILYHSEQILPVLVIDGVGPTALKIFLQYIAFLIDVFIIIYLAVRHRFKDVFSIMIVVASIYLMISDFYFASYRSEYDIIIFVGHLFNLAGFYFLQRAVYHTSVEEPFSKQKEVEQQLLRNEKFLQTITSHMGEGLIVMNKLGDLTYMNLEAEQILGWKQQDLFGKNVHQMIHRGMDGSLYPIEECPNTKCINEGKAFRIQEEYFLKKAGELIPVSYVVTPLFDRGQVNGSIMVFRNISEQKEAQEKIHRMAFYDELTDLPNFRFLKERLAVILSRQPKRKKAIVILDIDRFKNINEALGHSMGDLILKAVAKRLNDHVSGDMFLARMASDEFALLLPTLASEQDVNGVVEKIRDTFKEPIHVQHLLLNVSLSGGVALYPEHGKEVVELLKNANRALKEAQKQNKFLEFYQQERDGKILDRFVFENDLHKALANDELRVVYQPQIDLKSGKIFAVEALVRWKHPQQGLVSPAEFISIAESNGLIIPIGEWVLRTACRQVKQWHDQGFSPLTVGVNLSIRQFYQQNLVEKVKAILEETQLSPQYLELEITESMMMNVEHTTETLKALKQLGIQISIDDFGTGYSSLSYLRHLPVNRLKIDKSFVDDLLNEGDTTIVSTIISMAHHLGLKVIAEGVETLNQKDILVNQQCFQIQGFLVSPPLHSEEFTEQFQNIQQKAMEIVANV